MHPRGGDDVNLNAALPSTVPAIIVDRDRPGTCGEVKYAGFTGQNSEPGDSVPLNRVPAETVDLPIRFVWRDIPDFRNASR